MLSQKHSLLNVVKPVKAQYSLYLLIYLGHVIFFCHGFGTVLKIYYIHFVLPHHTNDWDTLAAWEACVVEPLHFYLGARSKRLEQPCSQHKQHSSRTAAAMCHLEIQGLT